MAMIINIIDLRRNITLPIALLELLLVPSPGGAGGLGRQPHLVENNFF